MYDIKGAELCWWMELLRRSETVRSESSKVKSETSQLDNVWFIAAGLSFIISLPLLLSLSI